MPHDVAARQIATNEEEPLKAHRKEAGRRGAAPGLEYKRSRSIDQAARRRLEIAPASPASASTPGVGTIVYAR